MFFLIQDADIAAAPLYVTRSRQQVVDFTVPFMTVQATLLFRKPPRGADTLHICSAEDLIPQSEIKYGTQEHSLIARAFKNTNISSLQIMWRRMAMNGGENLLTDTNEEGVQKVRSEKYAFVLPDTIGQYISLRQPCDLMTVDQFLMKEHYALAVPKGAVFKDTLNQALRRLDASEFLDRLRWKWWQGQDECEMAMHSRIVSDDGHDSASLVSPNACLFVLIIVLNTVLFV